MVNVYKFRSCLLNIAERRVLRDGSYLEMTPKAFDILRLLIERRGTIVSKDEILGEVWNGSFVEEGNLAVHVSKLRRTLDETKTNQFIETVQGCGYRFIAPVFEATSEEWQETLEAVATLDRDAGANEWEFDSIAVLPLENVTRDEEVDYLADGLTESFINSLSRFPNLRVIARNTVFRYRDKKVDAKQVGETLGVATVMTGRIRVLQDRLSIAIELTKTSDGSQLWGKTIRRPFTDIFDIQDDVLTEILESLQIEIDRVQKSLKKAEPTPYSESFRLHLKGKRLLSNRTRESTEKAQECFRMALPHNPTNIDSYVELAESYLTLYVSSFISFGDFMKEVKPVIDAIHELREINDAVHLTLGRIKYFEWDFRQSRKHFLSALRLNSNNVTARFRYSELLLTLGQFPEALRELNTIIQLDPLSFQSYTSIGRAYYRMRKFDHAAAFLNDVIDLEPHNFVALALLGATFAEIGDFDRASELLENSLQIHDHIETVSMLGYVAALKGDEIGARQIIDRINSNYLGNSEINIVLSRVYSALNQLDEAADHFERALVNHEPDVVAINSDPRLVNLRVTARMKPIFSKVGLVAPNS